MIDFNKIFSFHFSLFIHFQLEGILAVCIFPPRKSKDFITYILILFSFIRAYFKKMWTDKTIDTAIWVEDSLETFAICLTRD